METSNTGMSDRRKPEERVRDFQRKIYRKAKQEPNFRFYSLYDKVCRPDFLSEAYRRVRLNRGSPGIDGIDFEDIEKSGLEDFLRQIQTELLDGVYRPDPVKRVLIPKASGQGRPLGIPTIRDRVVQMSCKMTIEPIFEADFDDSSFGFRPRRAAKDAVKRIKDNLRAGRHEVYDADLSKYFDSIPHRKLLILVGQRISDRKVLHLLKLWLKAPVNEDGRISGGKRNKRGTPQGGVISPLLANIYLNLLDRVVRTRAEFRHIRMIRYADDFLLMGVKIGRGALDRLHRLLDRMELSVNENKSRLLNATDTSFEFLGFVFRYHKSRFNADMRYWHVAPSEKSLKSLRSKIKTNLRENRLCNEETTAAGLNPLLRGWLNYFTIEGVSYMKLPRRKIRIYLRDRLFRHQKRKSQRFRYGFCRKTLHRWITKYNLIDPEVYGISEPVKA